MTLFDYLKRQVGATNTKGTEVPNAETNPNQSTRQNSDIICRSGYLNEGTAMDNTKRQQLGLNGLLPARVETLDIQKNRALHLLRSKKDNMLEKYIMMAQLRTTNVRLFYKIVIDELEVCFSPLAFSF